MINVFVEYLKSKPELHCVMIAWKKQYEKLGHLGGKILLNDASDATKQSLTILLSKDYTYETKIIVSYSFWCKQLQQTKFSDCDFQDVLFTYFNDDITTKKQQKQAKLALFEQGFSSIQNRYQNTNLTSYITFICNNSNLTPKVKTYIQTNTLHTLFSILDALCNIPAFHNNHSLISIFASTYLQNPHAFDEGHEAYTFLYDCLCYLENKQKEKMTLLEKNALFTKYGLIKDDLSTHTMICHLLGKKQNKVHVGWSGFYDCYEPMIVTMENLTQIDAIARMDKIYIVENPSVFRMLSIAIKQAHQNVGCICTNGQLNSADYSILEFCKDQCLYYAGDFDPEGLLIAQKMMDMLPNLQLWHYETIDYYKCQSNETISQTRLKKLNSITHHKLQNISTLLLETQKAGYQENLLQDYINDLIL